MAGFVVEHELGQASNRASSVLPTPVGPRKTNEPIGRSGSWSPERARRRAFGRPLRPPRAPDHPPVQPLLHVDQLLGLAFERRETGILSRSRRRRRMPPASTSFTIGASGRLPRSPAPRARQVSGSPRRRAAGRRRALRARPPCATRRSGRGLADPVDAVFLRPAAGEPGVTSPSPFGELPLDRLVDLLRSSPIAASSSSRRTARSAWSSSTGGKLSISRSSGGTEPRRRGTICN